MSDEISEAELIHVARLYLQDALPWYGCFKRNRLLNKFNSMMEKSVIKKAVANNIGSIVKKLTIAKNKKTADHAGSVIDLIDNFHDRPKLQVDILISLKDVSKYADTFETYLGLLQKHRSDRKMLNDYTTGLKSLGQSCINQYVHVLEKYDKMPGVISVLAKSIAPWVIYDRSYERKEDLIKQFNSDMFYNILIDAHKISSKKATALAETITRSMLKSNSKNDTKYIIKMCDLLNKEFDTHVFKDFTRCSNLQAMLDIVFTEHHFLNQQSSETVFPLANMLIHYKYYYNDEKAVKTIKDLNECNKLNLARAYSIAKENPKYRHIVFDTNYLDDFFAGLNKVLENRPEMLGKWAESIIEGFKKKGENGLLRGVSYNGV